MRRDGVARAELCGRGGRKERRKEKKTENEKKKKKRRGERGKKGEGDGEIRAAIAAPGRPRAASGTRARSGATRVSRGNRVVDSDVGVGSFEDR